MKSKPSFMIEGRQVPSNFRIYKFNRNRIKKSIVAHPLADDVHFAIFFGFPPKI